MENKRISIGNIQNDTEYSSSTAEIAAQIDGSGFPEESLPPVQWPSDPSSMIDNPIMMPSLSLTTNTNQQESVKLSSSNECCMMKPTHWFHHKTNRKFSSVPFYNLVERAYPITCLLCTLLFFIMLNISLILWIVVSLNIHQGSTFLRRQSSSMIYGNYELEENNKLRINGDLMMNNTLYTNWIESQYHEPLSSPDIQTNTYQEIDQLETNPNYYQKNLLRIQSSSFPLENDDSDGELLLESRGTNPNRNSIRLLQNGNIELKINKKLVVESAKPQRYLEIGLNRLIIEDSSVTIPKLQKHTGGLRMTQLNTDSVVGCIHHDLRVESRTDKLEMTSKEMINIESINGAIDVNAYGDIMINSQNIKLDGKMVMFQRLNNPHIDRHIRHNYGQIENITNATNINDKNIVGAYQVCVCMDGQLFLAEESALCQADLTICGNRER